MAYQTTVLADSPALLWRCSEESGPVVADASGNAQTGTAQGGVTFAASGLLRADASRALVLDGSESTPTMVVQDGTSTLPAVASIEVWLRTTTEQGGVLAQFATADATQRDLTLYLRADGVPALRAGDTEIVRSPDRTVADGRIHHLVATLDGDAAAWLYVDGSQVAHHAGVTPSSPFTGRWQVGAGTTDDLAAPPASAAYAGTLDEVAIYQGTAEEEDAMQLIDAQTLASPTDHITFSAIPGTYRVLRLYLDGRGSSADPAVNVSLSINGDTGVNYDWQEMDAYDVTIEAAGAFNATPLYVCQVPAGTAPADTSGGAVLELPAYAGTTFAKRVSVSWDCKQATTTGGMQVQQQSAWWRNTAAITELTLTISAGNFVAQTTALLYGLT